MELGFRRHSCLLDPSPCVALCFPENFDTMGATALPEASLQNPTASPPDSQPKSPKPDARQTSTAAEGASAAPAESAGEETAPLAATPMAAADQQEIYIAVMGPTGTGKTRFINDATGAHLDVGDSLDSCRLFLVGLSAYPRSSLLTQGLPRHEAYPDGLDDAERTPRDAHRHTGIRRPRAR